MRQGIYLCFCLDVQIHDVFSLFSKTCDWKTKSELCDVRNISKAVGDERNKRPERICDF